MGFENIPLNVDYGSQKGWATIGGQTCYFRSKFERRWAEWLELLKQADNGTVDWQYEPKKFEFEKIRSGTVFYTPDFRVIYKELKEIYWHECKGHLTQKDITKFRRMAKYYPNEKIVLVMQNIPLKTTRKNVEKMRRLDNARKYVYRVIDGGQILKKIGL